MIQKETIVCRVVEVDLKAARSPRAEVELVDDDGEFYKILLTPGDSLDVVIDAWARGIRVIVVARSISTYQRKSKLLADVEKVVLAGLPKGAVAF